ncbi:MAG: TlpA family protein disulfide reductase [Acetobacter sp.]|nr:TlpA family protein disulfide reductase [Acetobacter sp.]
MSLIYRLIMLLCLISFNATAYSGPKGLYVLEYPVNMPNVSVISENNNETSILNTSADLTIMVFWAQSCAPCLREMKALEKFYKAAAQDNIRVMLISPASEWKNNTEERKFLAKYGAPTIPFYNDVDNALSLKLGIGSTPYTVIMDKQGKKVATIQGEANWSSDKLYQMIKKLVK